MIDEVIQSRKGGRQGLIDRLAVELRRELLERRRDEAASGGGRVPLERAIRLLVDREAVLLDQSTRDRLAEQITRDTIGLGPLEPLLSDPAVEEVLVNGPAQVFVERSGRLEATEVSFAGEQELRDVIERVLSPIGRRVDELSPMADGRLPDGSRVNVVIPPLAVDGPSISIRRFGESRPGCEELIRRGAMTEELRDLLVDAIAARCNLIISGGTGSGKTTVLNALSAYISADERVITVEDAAELRLVQPHVVRLESRPAGVEGGGEVSIRDLVRNALRMRPDRIIIGEVRGPEAMDLVMALNTGHRGALSTVHANGTGDAVGRLETLAMIAGLDLPHRVVSGQLSRAIDMVLHLERDREGGTRHASELARVRSVGGEARLETIWSREAAA